MKNINALFAAAVIAFDIMAGYTVFSYNYVSDEELYRQAVSKAEQYEKENLCEQAINSYETVLELQDTYEIRVKMFSLYDKGYEDKEFKSFDEKYDLLKDTINTYPNHSMPYEKIIEMYFYDRNFKECADYIKLAKQNKIKSGYIDKAYDTIKKMYELSTTEFTEITPLCDGTYLGSYERDPESAYPDCKQFNLINTSGQSTAGWVATQVSPASEGLVFIQQYGNYIDGDLKKINDEVAKKLVDGNYNNTSELNDKLYTSIENSDGLRVAYLDNSLISASAFGNGLICCTNSSTGLYTYFDSTGTPKLGDYITGGKFNDNITVITDKDGLEIIGIDGISKTEKKIDDVINNQIFEYSTNGRMFVKFGGQDKYSLVNSADMSVVGKFTCDDADLFIDGYAAFQSDEKWGFVNADGKVVIEPQYDNAKSFSNGLAAVMINGKWGFIDENNKLLFETDFTNVGYFSPDGMCFVRESNDTSKWSIIKMYYWISKETQQQK